MKTVLVTGAGGLIGSRVADAARASGWRVIPMLRVSPRDPAPDALIHDLAAPLAGVPAPDWVFHLAGAYAGADLAELQLADLRFAQNLVQWGIKEGVQNWVIASAAEVYGPIDGVGGEDVPTRPGIPYGEVKLTVEHVFRDFARRTPNAQVVLLRIGEVYGPRGRLAKELRARLMSGVCPWPGDGRVPVSFVHVDDVAQAFLCAASGAQAGVSIYNVADDEPATWRGFLEAFARMLRARQPIYLPRWLSNAYVIGAGLAAKLTAHKTVATRHTVRLLTTPKLLANARIRSDLGFCPRFPNFRIGLKQVVEAQLKDGECTPDL